MKTLLPLLLILPLAPGCTTQGAHGNDHWSGYSISNSMGRNILGYSQERDGDYIDFQDRQKRAFNLTLRRHFFHSNPENPFQPEVKGYFDPRLPHGPLPDVVTYLQDPLSSIIADFSEGGREENSAGLRHTAHELFGVCKSCRKSASYLRSSVGVVAEPATGE